MIRSKPLSRTVAAALVGLGLATTLPAFAHGSGHGPGHRQGGADAGSHAAERRFDPERMRARLKEATDRLGQKLQIKPQQQDAWTSFVRAREGLIDTRAQRPGPQADAATVARFRAEMAQGRAQRLGTLAEATAQLQAVLDPEQRKLLDEASRRGPRGMQRGPGGEPRRGEGERRRSHFEGDAAVQG